MVGRDGTRHYPIYPTKLIVEKILVLELKDLLDLLDLLIINHITSI